MIALAPLLFVAVAVAAEGGAMTAEAGSVVNIYPGGSLNIEAAEAPGTCVTSNIADGAIVTWAGYEWVNTNNGLTPNQMLSGGDVQVTGWYENQGATKPNLETTSTFSRPLNVSVMMRLESTQDLECIGIQVFPPAGCTRGHSCGYTMGLGWWKDDIGIVTDMSGAHSKYGSHGDPYHWHHVKIVLGADGQNHYYYDDRLILSDTNNEATSGTLRFLGCNTGQFTDLVVA